MTDLWEGVLSQQSAGAESEDDMFSLTASQRLNAPVDTMASHSLHVSEVAGTQRHSKPCSSSTALIYNKVRMQYFNDPVHNLLHLPPLAAKIYDTRQFQRLSDLKQLGLTYQVFRGASHNRLEHSLGVAHLAWTTATKVAQFQAAELDWPQREQVSDIKVIQIAGLCHDLGHGPFSHVFEHEFLRRKQISGWSHEDMSVQLFDRIRDENVHNIGEAELSEDEAARVRDIIRAGDPSKGVRAPEGKRWQYEIVANGRNGLDVDKFDYLQRDSLYCNVKINADFDRLQKLSKVIDDEICYKWSEYENVLTVYQSRASMHRRVYCHRKAKAIELMVVDAMLEADAEMRIAERIADPDLFVTLDDTLLKQIEWHGLLPGLVVEREGPLRKAKALLQRLRERDLYRYVDAVQVPVAALRMNTWRKPEAEDVVGYNSSSNVSLRPEDVILVDVKIDLTNGENNPVDRVSFFDHASSTMKYTMVDKAVSPMFPEVHQERQCRIYSRSSDPRTCAAVKQAFRTWVAKQFGDAAVCATPCPVPAPHESAAPAPLAVPSRKRNLATVYERADVL